MLFSTQASCGIAKLLHDECSAEWDGEAGKVIRHKFVVFDFDQPSIVFCGSSNLADGGEISNGDNLIAISYAQAAIVYAVEAIRPFDHYRFRSLHQQSTAKNPLALRNSSDRVKPYYDSKDIRFNQRKLLIG